MKYSDIDSANLDPALAFACRLFYQKLTKYSPKRFIIYYYERIPLSFSNFFFCSTYLSYKMFANRLQILSGISKTIFQAPFLRFAASAAIKPTMEKHQVVPDVIPVAPADVAKVNYVSGVSVDLGNELTPTAVKDVPKVEWNADASTLYTLCMTDPDAPSRQEPTYREVCSNKRLKKNKRIHRETKHISSGIIGWSATFLATTLPKVKLFRNMLDLVHQREPDCIVTYSWFTNKMVN